MTFQEKSLWVTLLALVVVFGGYFQAALATLLPLPQARDVLPHQAVLFIGATVMLVIILVAGHIAIAIRERHTEPDERDRAIAHRGERWGGFVLAVGVFGALCTAVFTQGNAIMAHVLLAAWVLAQLVEIVAQLVLYRRGG